MIEDIQEILKIIEFLDDSGKKEWSSLLQGFIIYIQENITDSDDSAESDGESAESADSDGESDDIDYSEDEGDAIDEGIPEVHIDSSGFYSLK